MKDRLIKDVSMCHWLIKDRRSKICIAIMDPQKRYTSVDGVFKVLNKLDKMELKGQCKSRVALTGQVLLPLTLMANSQ